MVEEGEFKKRLVKKSDTYVFSVLTIDDIDEAKREFPREKEIEREFDLKPNEINPEKQIAVWMSLANRRFVWFSKWFGSEPLHETK